MCFTELLRKDVTEPAELYAVRRFDGTHCMTNSTQGDLYWMIMGAIHQNTPPYLSSEKKATAYNFVGRATESRKLHIGSKNTIASRHKKPTVEIMKAVAPK